MYTQVLMVVRLFCIQVILSVIDFVSHLCEGISI